MLAATLARGDTARGTMAHIQLISTLATMAEIYTLPREGGAASPRFKRYLELIPSNYALVAYNPMAGPHALETTEQLLAVNAEAVAMEAARTPNGLKVVSLRGLSRFDL